jgi:hypothetical protein
VLVNRASEPVFIHPGEAMRDPTKQAELTKELKSARNYLFVVGLLMFAVDMLFIHVLQKDQLTPKFKNVVTAIDIAVLAAFVTLGLFVHKRPRLCLIAGLVLFWVIQLAGAYDNPKALTQGILLKVLFTMALVKGLRSAGRAQVLSRELGEVFE